MCSLRKAREGNNIGFFFVCGSLSAYLVDRTKTALKWDAHALSILLADNGEFYLREPDY